MVGAQGISAYLYIYHMGLEFNLPTLPETITDTMPINFHKEDVLARSAPQITFSSAGPRSVNINIKLHRHIFTLENPQLDKITGQQVVPMMDPLTAKTLNYPATDAADLLVNALLTLSLPRYQDSAKAIVPPSVLVRYGKEMCIRGVPDTVTKTTSGPWLKSGKQAIVDISFNLTETEPFSAQYVAENGSLRSISADLKRSSVWQW